MKKLRVGILGATGMVGQRLITLLNEHPWFELVVVAASPQSSGKTYKDAVKGRWKMDSKIPKNIGKLNVFAVDDKEKIIKLVDFVFCALNMEKEAIMYIEKAYASSDIPVISTNSANRWSEDVPMLIPEINPGHIKLIDTQRKKHGWKKGFIVVKPNCSIQSYVSIITALKEFQPIKVHVTSLQAISGAGKTFENWPEMIDNVIPFIRGEEEKSEKEPMKIWAELINDRLKIAQKPEISATCIRVSVSNGHMACVSLSFIKNPTKEQILNAIKHFNNPISELNLPSSPNEFIHYFEEEDRPQTRLDRDTELGMGITMGRLQKDKHFDWKFVTLSDNTIRGAAGGAILIAELLKAKGYIR